MRGLFVLGIMTAAAGIPMFSTHAAAADNKSAAVIFPFLGEVNTNNINVRSGHGVNFEKVGQLLKGEKIVVLGEDNGWYKIRLPRTTENFVSAQFVKAISKDEGVVTGDRVNVRSGAGVDFPMTAQLERGAMISLTACADGWCKFESSTDIYSWVSREYIVFKSGDVGGVQKSAALSPEVFAVTSDLKFSQKNVELPGVVRFSGTVERQESSRFKDARFKLVNDGATSCFLIGPQALIEDFLHYNVEVEGILTDAESQSYPVPAVHVQKIQLVL